MACPSLSLRAAESPGGISPPGAHRTGLEILTSSGSSSAAVVVRVRAGRRETASARTAMNPGRPTVGAIGTHQAGGHGSVYTSAWPTSPADSLDIPSASEEPTG